MKAIFTLLLMFFGATAFAQTVVVVPKNSKVKSLNDVDVANIFLARTNRFPNGENRSLLS